MVVKTLHLDLQNQHLIETNGETLNNKSEIYDTMLGAIDGTTYFIDEAHALHSKVQNILLTAISEKVLHVPARNRKDRGYNIPLKNITWILATTDEYRLRAPLRNRMKIICRFEYYTTEDLVEVVRQRADMLGWAYESDEVLHLVSQRAKGTPRLALHRNLQTCWHVAQSYNRDIITLDDTHEAFYHLHIDEVGLDQLDRAYLMMLSEHEKTPLNVLSSKLSLSNLTIQRVVEPYLLKEGFITKDKSSMRMIIEKGINHITNTSVILEESRQYGNVIKP